MTSRSLRYTALFIFAVSWTLHVIRGGVTLPKGLPGWEAFRVAFSPVWPYADVRVDTWYWAAPDRRRASVKWIAVVAFIINSQWLVFGDGDWRGLRIGYYLWWISFLLLAASYTVLGSHAAPPAVPRDD